MASEVNTPQRREAAKLIEEEFRARAAELRREPTCCEREEKEAQIRKPHARKIAALEKAEARVAELREQLAEATKPGKGPKKARSRSRRHRCVDDWQSNIREQVELALTCDQSEVDKLTRKKLRLLSRVQTAVTVTQLTRIYKDAGLQS